MKKIRCLMTKLDDDNWVAIRSFPDGLANIVSREIFNRISKDDHVIRSLIFKALEYNIYEKINDEIYKTTFT